MLDPIKSIGSLAGMFDFQYRPDWKTLSSMDLFRTLSESELIAAGEFSSICKIRLKRSILEMLYEIPVTNSATSDGGLDESLYRAVMSMGKSPSSVVMRTGRHDIKLRRGCMSGMNVEANINLYIPRDLVLITSKLAGERPVLQYGFSELNRKDGVWYAANRIEISVDPRHTRAVALDF